MSGEEIDYQEILENLGYDLGDRGEYWQTNALYRSGDNKTALQIYKDTGVWKDYVEESKFMPFAALLSLHNLGDAEIKNILKNQANPSQASQRKKEDPVSTEEIFSEEILSNLLPHYKFYEEKGINQEVLKLLQSGLSTQGQMYQRFVFPIRNIHGQIHGFAGRDMTTKSERPKWKHLGRKTKWIYPYYNLIDRNEKTQWNGRDILLVESIGDMLSLKQNLKVEPLVTFGLDISPSLISFLISINPKSISICLNNDADKTENRGLDASIKNYLKLLSFFDFDKIKICLPFKGDFGDMKAEDFTSWQNKFNKIQGKDQRVDVMNHAEKLIKQKKLSKNLVKNLKIINIHE